MPGSRTTLKYSESKGRVADDSLRILLLSTPGPGLWTANRYPERDAEMTEAFHKHGTGRSVSVPRPGRRSQLQLAPNRTVIDTR